jgi:hypothetical protein
VETVCFHYAPAASSAGFIVRDVKKMKKLPIALALTTLTAGFTHAADIVYSSEDFEAGTPNYTIDDTGVGTFTEIGAITPATAFTGTDYLPGGSAMGIVTSGQPENLSPGGTIPPGQHAFVSRSSNRHMTLANPMTLVTDGVQSINVSFSYMFYGLGSFDALGSAELLYSANGLFTDTVRLATFGFGQAGSTVVTPNYFATQDTWSTLNLSFTEAGAGITFTDTAKIRINRVGLVAPVTVGETVNHFTFFDDITVTGIPTSAPAAPFVATIVPAVDPNTGYDLQWTSQTGKTYSVLASTDLATPVDTWTVVQTGIAPTPPQNSYNVPSDGPRRFYVIKETLTP